VGPNNSLDKRQPAGDSAALDNMSTISKGEPEEPGKAVEKLRDLLGKAHQNQEAAVPKIRQILSEHPDLARQFVDVAQVAEDALINMMTKEGDLAAKELIRCQLEAMREQIAGKNSSALELLLSERVVTWLDVQFFEALYAQNMRKLTIPQAEHHQKRLDRAHRRHLSAIGALAQMHKLLKGTAITQINIADKQINTTG
jgi:hypothetical protein